MKNTHDHDHSIKTDSLLKETSSHYFRLIGDADRKARIMIVVNSILVTIGITVFTKTMHDTTPYWISAILLIIANLVSLFFTIVSIQPDLHTSITRQTEDNILHYKKCIQYTLSEYITQVMQTMQDSEKKMQAVLKELYYFGNLLNKKYRLQKIAFRCFYWGIVVAVVSYLLIILFEQF